MDITKTVSINGADGKPIVFTYDSVVTQWHVEEVSKALRPYMQYFNRDTKKLDMPDELRVEMKEAQDAKMIETYIRSWDKTTPLTLENIKRSLLPEGFTELLNLASSVNDGDWTAEKKSTLPNDSLSASTPNEPQTAQ